MLTQEKKETERRLGRETVVYFDLLNVIACVCVIGVHCNGIVHTFSDTLAWKESLVVETLGYWSVPGFLMLSGATMMDYRSRYSTAEFLKRRCLRVGIPFVLWSVIFFFVQLFFGWRTWNGVRDFISVIINCQAYKVYWFFAPLFVVYMSLPVLSRLAEDKRILWYMVGLGIATESVLPWLCTVCGISYSGGLLFTMTADYVMFPILGYLLHNTELRPAHRVVVYLLGLVGVCARYGHTLIASVRDGALNTLTWEFTNWPTVLFSVAIFVLFKYAYRRFGFLRKEGCARLFHWLSGASFGIYLVHVFVMTCVVGVFDIDESSTAWRAFGAIAVYCISLVGVKVLQKIPYVGKYLFP